MLQSVSRGPLREMKSFRAFASLFPLNPAEGRRDCSATASARFSLGRAGAHPRLLLWQGRGRISSRPRLPPRQHVGTQDGDPQQAGPTPGPAQMQGGELPPGDEGRHPEGHPQQPEPGFPSVVLLHTASWTGCVPESRPECGTVRATASCGRSRTHHLRKRPCLDPCCGSHQRRG